MELGRRWVGVSFSVVLLSLPVIAEEAADPEARALEEERGTEEVTEGLRVFGRVVARARADERQQFARDIGVSSARLGVEATFRNLDAVVEADLSSSSLLRDAYLRLHDDANQLRLYGGRFKAPFLARELESSWDLPLISRGMVDGFLIDGYELGGRRYGLMGEARYKKLHGLKASVGVFRGAFDETLREYRSEDLAARVSVKPFKQLTVGASGYRAEALGGVSSRYAWAADATVKLGAFELRAEGLQARLPVGRVLAGIGLLTYALALDAKREWQLEPTLGAEVMQLRAEQVGTGHALTGGLGLRHGDSFKVQVQLERALRPNDEKPGHEVALQLGARF